MSDDRPPADAHDAAASWATICAEFFEIRLQANKHDFHARFDALAAEKGRDPELLARWLDLIAELADRNAEETAKNVGQYANEARRQTNGPDSLPAYVCPDGRCARQEEPMFGVGPPCNMTGEPMRPTE